MGPLKGLKVIEIGGMGPGPFAGMMLADMGAEVIVVERKGREVIPAASDCNRRGKKSIALDLKKPEDIATVLKLVAKADVLFEGFRPGVMEKLGLGPDVCLQLNPRLIYGRMTGWGQTGPLATTVGHDINYIALTGALHAIGDADRKPMMPLNLVGDYGGGAMFLVTGLLAALYEVQQSGKGQVVDAAMTDGSAVLMSLFYSLNKSGGWSVERGSNFLDSGAHFYNTYETSDQKYISIGPIEPKFYKQLIELLKLDKGIFGEQYNPQKWPRQKKELAAIFKSKSRKEWCDLLEGKEVCFAPVLDFLEAEQHPHNKARGTYIHLDGQLQPAPAPRFSRTVSKVKNGPRKVGEDTEAVLKEWGVL